ncbi:hypothetical protein M378DRAFT_17268 [Amanita muscaria Koide BX008]|uniref:Uncharacterized protein n=1 Tax=Amanita muscaria (strain Koide BX008) TaxID=946122 RepID=A0A0C2WHV0_AMAMK|nr:hypothetical protein M378DRAFT_17268 [Amanita muscaria Koide BX008]
MIAEILCISSSALSFSISASNIREVMKQQKAEIKNIFDLEDSLSDEHKAPFRIKIFLWEFLMKWLTAGRKVDDSFVQEQCKAMHTLDKQAGPVALAQKAPVDGAKGGLGPAHERKWRITLGPPLITPVPPEPAVTADVYTE